ncbi:MAG: LTA synthase family protein [Sedimentisphaerales bacterium]|nr:LTA synthase family protein [Sedimentisphaerales bacterium]
MQRQGGWILLRWGRGLYRAMAPRAHSVLIFAALFCSLAVKLHHADQHDVVHEYPAWILTDIAVLVTIELVLAVACFRWPKKWVLRTATGLAAVVCTWSVMNAGWVIGTGTQILPMELSPLFRDPSDILRLLAKKIASRPAAASVLLVPSAVALAFFFSVMARPVPPKFERKAFAVKVAASIAVILVALLGHAAARTLGSPHIAAAGLYYNCQSRAVLAFLLPRYRHIAKEDFENATRSFPRADEVEIAFEREPLRQNVVIIVLESVQYARTSLADTQADGAGLMCGATGGPTPYLRRLAAQGAWFTQMRSTVTHTTKALFALLTGRVPSACQDISETIPTTTPYASLATILGDGLGYRTAFFQSAKGTFEARPGLVHNLGFDEFRAREDVAEPDAFLGYLACDEFALLGPIVEWMKADDSKPFLFVMMCSATHDPYELPAWFGAMAPTPALRYEQTITYTDRFLEALDVEMARLGLTDNTVFCVIGDHGEAFGEHHIQGHERVAYEEVLHVPWCVRAPLLIEPGTRINVPVSSVDLTPTILSLLGLDTEPFGFEGADALAPPPADRKLFFSGWMQQGPAGFLVDDSKFVYDPEQGAVSLFRLRTDPLELSGFELPEHFAQQVSDEIVNWRKGTIFKLHQEPSGQKLLYDTWLCKWSGRIATVKRVKTP